MWSRESPDIAWRRRGRYRALLRATLVAILLTVVCAAPSPVGFVFFAIVAMALGGAAGIARGGPLIGARPAGARGFVALDGDTLRLGDVTQPLASLSCGWREGTRTVLRFADGATAYIELEAEDARELDERLALQSRVIEAPVGRSASTASRAIRGAGAAGMALVALLCLFFALLGVGLVLAAGVELDVWMMCALAVPLFIVIAFELVRSLPERQLRIGADGVEIVGMRRVYVPFGDLGDVRVDGRSLLFMRPARRIVTSSAMEATVLAQLIERARTAHAHASGSDLDLVCGRRSVNEWMVSLRAMRAAYRGTSDEALLAAAASPRVPREVRIAAAYALGPTPKLRVVAESVVDPVLRDALAHAAEGDLDARVLARAAARR